MAEQGPQGPPGARLRALVTLRSASFAQELCALFWDTVANLEREVRLLRAENAEQRRVLQETERHRGRRRKRRRRRNGSSPERPDFGPDEDPAGPGSDSREAESEDEWGPGARVKDQESEPTENSSDSEPTENSSDSEERELSSAAGPEPAASPPEQTQNPSDPEREGHQAAGHGASRRQTAAPQHFSCPICLKRFSNRSDLKSHAKWHRRSLPFECADCGSSFHSKYHLVRHQQIHQRNRPWGGHQEEEAEGTGRSDAVPQRGMDGEGPAPPEDEDEPEDEPDPEPEDEPDPEPEDEPDPEPEDEPDSCLQDAWCPRCHKGFSTPGNMARHMRTVHRSTKQQQLEHRFACSFCEKRFWFQSELKRHMKSHPQTSSVKKLHQCHICQKSFRGKLYIQDHIRMHLGVKPYKCVYCSRTFTFRNLHNAHMKTHEDLS